MSHHPLSSGDRHVGTRLPLRHGRQKQIMLSTKTKRHEYYGNILKFVVLKDCHLHKASPRTTWFDSSQSLGRSTQLCQSVLTRVCYAPHSAQRPCEAASQHYNYIEQQNAGSPPPPDDIFPCGQVARDHDTVDDLTAAPRTATWKNNHVTGDAATCEASSVT